MDLAQTQLNEEAGEDYVFQVLPDWVFPADMPLAERIREDQKTAAALKAVEDGGPYIAHEDMVAWVNSLATDNPLPAAKLTYPRDLD